VKLEPTIDLSDIKELLIFCILDLFSLFIQNLLIKLQKSNFGFSEGITILSLNVYSHEGFFIKQTPLTSLKLLKIFLFIKIKLSSFEFDIDENLFILKSSKLILLLLYLKKTSKLKIQLVKKGKKIE